MTRLLLALRAHINDVLFVVGLAILCGSVARWSPAAAGVVLGLVLITVAVWPLLTRMRNGE